MVDPHTHEAAGKLMSKTSRWRTRMFDKTAAADDTPPSKTQDPADLDAFLKPSLDRAQQHKDAARPRIDVSRAQRWPAAQAILAGAAAVTKSPGPGGMRTGSRARGLRVAFARTVPDVIGHGGDECEDPAIVVSRQRQQKKQQQEKQEQQEKPQQQHPRPPSPPVSSHDDALLGTQTAALEHTPEQAEQRNSLTRTLTSPGEMSPPLGRKMHHGHINAYAPPPPNPPPLRLGPMGLGQRPRGLARAPTGFDSLVLDTADAASPSSDNSSPVVSRTAPTLPPIAPEKGGDEDEDEDTFQPKSLSRVPTGFQGYVEPATPADSDPPPPLPAPAEEQTFAAKAQQRMRSEEGRVLHEAAQRAASGTRRDSDGSSIHSADRLSVISPPSAHPQPDTVRPVSPSSSQYSAPSVASPPPPASPSTRMRPDPSSVAHAPSHQRIPSHQDKPTYLPYSHGPALPTPAQSEERSLHLPPPSLTPASQAPAPMQTLHTTASVAPSDPDPPIHIRSNVHPHSSQPSQSSQSFQPFQASTPSSQTSAPQPFVALTRSDTKMLNETAYRDFADRVIHMKGIFQLTAQLGGQLYNHAPSQWIRAATWWFLKGRTGMESLIRSQAKGVEPQQERLTQPHVDLAKVWWILNQVLPSHPALQSYVGPSLQARAEAARQAGDIANADALEVQNAIGHYMKLLVGSMRKHKSMPPTQALIQGQDQSIWEEYPTFPPDTASVLTCKLPPMAGSGGVAAVASQNGAPTHINISQYMPITDTKTEFCYFRLFVKATIATDDPNTDRVPMPAVLSVLRPKDQYPVKLAVCSQSNLINIIVGNGSEVTWKDVNWNKSSRKISIQLRHGFALSIELSEGDMRSLWSIVDHTNRAETDLRERRDERFLSKVYLRDASYKDPTNPAAFPLERVPGCKLMVFHKFDRSSEGTGKRKLHRGYRMVLVTPPHFKQVSLVNHEVGTKQEPLNFGYVTEPDQAPALRLHLREEAPDKQARHCMVHLVFQDSKDRNHLFGALTSMNVNDGEMAFAQVPLKALHIESAEKTEGFSQRGSRILEKIHWQEAKVLNLDPEAAGLESAPTIKSESLRIVCRHTAGIISDRMNLGSGELLVRLPTDGTAELMLLREPQQDVVIAIDGSRTDRDVPDALAELLRTLETSSTIRRLTFDSFQDLHTFQFAVTGFAVKFDGTALTFSISRRRMVVPIYKQWTANNIRLQIVQQDNIIQLLAFFQDFSHADAMNFQLRTMDTFEKSDKGGKFGLKLVDAKFALPVEERRGEGKMQKEEGRLTGWSGVKRRFVCLDEIEYPGEHDDILIQFDSAETRDRFVEALPAATMQRKFTVRRKI